MVSMFEFCYIEAFHQGATKRKGEDYGHQFSLNYHRKCANPDRDR